MDNIILIGMAGCGKSTVGVLLAKILGYNFIDTDLLIQERAGKRLFEILRDDGYRVFSRFENEALCSLNAKRTVVATGGSAVLSEEGMKNLKKLGKVVYIRLPYEEIEKRIDNLETRGILMKKGQTLKDVFDERLSLYEGYADVVYDALNKNLSTCAVEISRLI